MVDSSIPKFNTPFLNDYLRMVEDTESPRIMHIWSAVGAIAASLGRRNYLPFGDGVIYPNHYIALVGAPGTRKSTALNTAKNQLKKATGVKFAPDDTAGQRQGLVKAMLRGSSEETLYLNGVNLDKRDDSLRALTMVELSQVTDEAETEEQREVDEADKQHLMATSDELGIFIGQNNTQLLNFLTSAWDGREYEYDTNTKSVVLKRPLLNLISCTTPVSIANSMPSAAVGQGFLSRLILVYGAKKYKHIARPPSFPIDAIDSVRSTLNNIYTMLHGPFEETPDAKAYSESLYGWPLEISDARFGHYHDRRYTHLIKLAMCLAAGRESHTIVRDDYDEAHRILRATERGMPDALGEFGMNPLASLKQAILEFMRDSLAMPLDELRAQFHRDARSSEFIEVVNDLVRTKQLVLNQSTSGRPFVTARITKGDTEDGMLKLLAER